MQLPQMVRAFWVTFSAMFQPATTESYPEEKDKFPPKPRFHGRHQLNRHADGLDRKSRRLNSSYTDISRMPSSA